MHHKRRALRILNMEYATSLPELRSRILAGIRRVERRRALTRLFVSTAVVLFSIAGIVWSVRATLVALNQSGFYEYASLMQSDSGAVLSSWKEFVLSVAESIPFGEITIALAAAAALLFSIKMLSDSVHGARIFAFN